MSKSAVIHIRIEPELLDKVKKRADEQGRKVSDWAARALAHMVKARKVV